MKRLSDEEECKVKWLKDLAAALAPNERHPSET